MRLTVLAAAIIVFPSLARSADYGLPPPPDEIDQAPVAFNWGGIYGGIHADYANTDFQVQSLATKLVNDAYYASVPLELARDFTRMSDSSKAGPGFGGFIGYNWNWDGAIIGLEADFTALSSNTAHSVITKEGRRRTIGSSTYSVASDGEADLELNNITILKLRGGVPFGSFMPYGTVGFALGYQKIRANYRSTGIEQAEDGSFISGGPANASVNKSGFVPGLALGLGADWALLPNLFLRAEYQYVAFSGFKGVDTTANLVRAGIAFKY